MLSAKYQDEQAQLDEQLNGLKAKLNETKQTSPDAEKMDFLYQGNCLSYRTDSPTPKHAD